VVRLQIQENLTSRDGGLAVVPWRYCLYDARNIPRHRMFTRHGAMVRDLCKIFAGAFALGFSGAVTPGPLLLVCAYATLRGGFPAGMVSIAGHAAAELVLVVILLAGLARALKTRPRLFRGVKIVAGLVLLGLGAAILFSAPGARLDIADDDAFGAAGPFIMGAAVSVGNPYWAIWWATVGLTLLGNAAKHSRIAVPTFYIGHVLSDFVWFAFVSASVALGRTAILGPTSYRVLLAASGLFMVGFGAWFAFKRDRKATRRSGSPPPA